MAVTVDYLRKVSDAIDAISENGQKLARSRIDRIIADGGYSDPMDAVDEIADALEDILQNVAGESASVSARSYDFVRTDSIGEALGARAYPDRDASWTRDALHGIAKDHRDDMDAFAEGVLARIDYEAKRAAGTTQFRNGARDPRRPRFARVPTGRETCMFCLMLASRGFVYLSEDAAGKLAHYHANCGCRVVASFDSYEVRTERGGVRRLPGTVIEGYKPEAIYNAYLDCAKTIFPELAVSRDNMLSLPESATKAILREMGNRDPEWLRIGRVPEVEYDKPGTEAWRNDTKQKRRDHKEERKAANRLSGHGIKCVFVVDEKRAVNNGIDQTIGLADLEGGKEIKSLKDASTYNTIDGYIRDTSRKRNARFLFFDNSQNDFLSDDDLGEYIKKSRRFKRGSIYVYGHDDQLRKIR